MRGMVTVGLALLGSVFACAERVEASVVAHWRFEEGPAGGSPSGAGSVLDSSASGLHMNPVGTPRYVNVPNPNSTLGLEFYRAGQLLDRSDSSLLNHTSLTVEAFIRYDGGMGLRQVFFRGDYRAGKDPFYLAVLDGKLRFLIDNLLPGGARAVHSPTVLPTGKFLHVAGTLNNDTNELKLFIDGVQVASQNVGGIRPGSSLFGSARMSIGGLSDGRSRGQYFDGVIDEVRISNQALSPSQFLNASPVPEPASIAAWSILLLVAAALTLQTRYRTGVVRRE